VETRVLAFQAHVLMWVGCAWLATGLWLGFDPITVAWRAAVAAVLAMWLSGKLLHVVVGTVNDRLAAELTERTLAAEQATRTTGPQKPAATPRARPAEAKAR
jgi:hypothetical protein